MSQSKQECGWAGELPEFKTTAECQQCGLQRTAGQVIRCKMQGPPTAGKPPAAVVNPETRVPPKALSGIGDCLKARFEEKGLKQTSTCPCKDIQAALNKTGAEEVESAIEHYVDYIFANTKNLQGLMGTAVRAYAWVSPDSAKGKIRELLKECLTVSRNSVS